MAAAALKPVVITYAPCSLYTDPWLLAGGLWHVPCSLAPAQCRDNYNVPRRSRTIEEAARPRAVRVVKLESGRSRGLRAGYRLTLSQRGRPVRSFRVDVGHCPPRRRRMQVV